MFSLITSIITGIAPLGDTVAGQIATGIWNEAYSMIKEIVVPLATSTFALSFVYFTWIGKDRDSLDKAKKLMIGSIAAVIIVYVAPKIINAFVTIAKSLG